MTSDDVLAAVKEHGTLAAAARALGISDTTVSRCVRGDLVGPLDPTKIGKRHRPSRTMLSAAEAIERIAAVEAELVAVRAELATLVGLVGQFVHRQPVVLGTVGPNRRKADGGEGGKREARAIRRVAGG